MSKCFSTFVDNRFYYDFVALFNSWRYYEHKTPFKVYISGPLDPGRRTIIERYCEVVEDPAVLLPANKRKYAFKFIALINNMCDQEIFLDTDTLFLNNVDHVFDHLEKGKLVVAEESNANITHSNYSSPEAWPARHAGIQACLKQHLGDVATKFTPDLVTPNYNMGFLGLRKDMHRFLLEKTVELLQSDFDTLPNPTSNFEQFTFNLMVQLYDPVKEVLPQTAWMNTWDYHKKPKKSITMDQGKFAVYDENNTRVNFYHFTAGFYIDKDGKNHPVKPHMLFDQSTNAIKFTTKELEDCYYVKNNNPLLLLFEHFGRQSMR